MPDLGALAASLAIGLLIVVMLWFTFGTQRNIRIGNDLLRWLQTGLPILGRRTTLRWLGSSAVQLDIVEPADPFKEATVVVVLEPRDVGALWAFARSRGRRDFIIVRLSLRRAPHGSVDAGDPVGWTGRLGEMPPDEGWQRLDWPGGIVAWAGGGVDTAAARAAWQELERLSGGVWRLTIQQVVPHIEVHVRPPDTGRVAAERLMTAIRDLAMAVSRPR